MYPLNTRTMPSSSFPCCREVRKLYSPVPVDAEEAVGRTPPEIDIEVLDLLPSWLLVKMAILKKKWIVLGS